MLIPVEEKVGYDLQGNWNWILSGIGFTPYVQPFNIFGRINHKALTLISVTTMNPIHLAALIAAGYIPQGAVGKIPNAWAMRLLENIPHLADHLLEPLPDHRLSRQELFHYCDPDNGIPDLNCIIAIFAWGGMRLMHGQHLFANHLSLMTLLGLANQLRTIQLFDRVAAYNAFKNVRADGALPGCGPAYFTKLICFLGNGYIMDQWTSKSINLIFEDNLVNIANGGWVNDNNDGEIYEEFCSRIHQVSVELECTALVAEERLFSKGGHNPGSWRAYLKAHYGVPH